MIFEHIVFDDTSAQIDTEAVTAAKIELVWGQFSPVGEILSHERKIEAEERLLSHLSAFLYRRILETLPALVRSWWSDNSNRYTEDRHLPRSM